MPADPLDHHLMVGAHIVPVQARVTVVVQDLSVEIVRQVVVGRGGGLLGGRFQVVVLLEGRYQLLKLKKNFF